MAPATGDRAKPGAHESREDIQVDVKLLDIIDYVGDSVRPIREGSAVHDAKHIVCIGYTSRQPDYVEVTGYVRQSSHPSQIPHKVDLKLTDSIASWVLKCSCKAGTNRCKHIVACLLELNRSGKVEYVSCTSATQAWGTTKAERSVPWGAKPISELCCVNCPKHPEPTDVALKQQILAESFSRILRAAKGSAIQKHREGRFLNVPHVAPCRAMQNGTPSDDYCSLNELSNMLCSTDEKIYVARVQFSTPEEEVFYNNNIAKDLAKILQIADETREQSSNFWRIQRSLRITASSCYKLYTYLFNEKADWERKISQYWSLSNLRVQAVKYGTETEKLAFDCYKIKRNPLVRKCGLVVKPGDCWFAASPDGVDTLNNVLVEIKCPLAGEQGGLLELESNKAVQKYLKLSKVGHVLNPRHAYYCQVQMNMWVLQCDSCDFIVYSKKENDFIVVEVPFDKMFVENVTNGLKGLYFTKMLVKLLPSTS